MNAHVPEPEGHIDPPIEKPQASPAATDSQDTLPSPPADDAPSAQIEMPFLDHLEELRWRILKSIGAVLVGAVICFVFSDQLMQALTYPYEEAVLSLENQRPAGVVGALKQLVEHWLGADTASSTGTQVKQIPASRRLQSLKPMTYFVVSLEIALLGGFVLALPMIFYQAWMFIAPGLLRRERRLLVPVVALSVLCFVTGAMVAYWIVLPLGLRFFLALEPPDMTSQWAVDMYMSFVLRLLLGFGLVFEMPVLSFFLSRLGLVTPRLLRHVRRYAIVVIFVVAAIFTPPDPMSQVLMALPLLLLYEISIWVSRLSRRGAA